jgi:hypothetical protein
VTVAVNLHGSLIFAFSVRSAGALGPVAIINLDSDMCLQPADSTTVCALVFLSVGG